MYIIHEWVKRKMYAVKLYDSRMRTLFICECLDGFFKS